MFDYQAGEKYRMTLIMVGVAGLIAGIFFTVLLMPAPEPEHRRQMPAYMHDSDITGVANSPHGDASSPGAAQAMPSGRATVDPIAAKSFMEGWLPMVWDLSAATAKDSQEKAIACMTPECAASYRKNIWTPKIAKQIEESSVESSFQTDSLKVGDIQADGSVVISVQGKQTLSAAGNDSSRDVKVQYVMVQTADGERIAEVIDIKH